MIIFKMTTNDLVIHYLQIRLSMSQAADSMISWIMNFKNNDSGAEKMEAAQEKYMPLSQRRKNSFKIHTTLYELMETVIDVADPEDTILVNEATINILTTAKPNIRVV